MNPFTEHPRRQGITYAEHWRFAMGIACRLLRSVAAFAVHAVFPFVSISPELDLESTARFMTESNAWIEAAGAADASCHVPLVPPSRTDDNTGLHRTPPVVIVDLRPHDQIIADLPMAGGWPGK